MSEDAVSAAYGSMADLYIELFGAVSSMHVDDLALIERHLGSCVGPVLDLGCGPGFTSLALARRVGPGGRVIACDESPRFLAHLRSVCEREGIDVPALPERIERERGEG